MIAFIDARFSRDAQRSEENLASCASRFFRRPEFILTYPHVEMVQLSMLDNRRVYFSLEDSIMAALQPRYDKEEFARRGQTIYDRDIQPRVRPEDDGKFAAVDIETGAYEIDEDDYTATERLLARNGDAQIQLLRVGHRSAYTIGGSSARAENS